MEGPRTVAVVLILFFIGLTLLPEIRFARHHSNLSFRLLIADANRRAFACAEAIRSVTHLVLAPDFQGKAIHTC